MVTALSAMLPADVLAQQSAATISELTEIGYPQNDYPPTGPFSVVIEHDPGLATHTIYRPAELTMRKHRVLVWGEGGCANNGLMFPEFLSEIASHGFVVVADGPPEAAGAGRGGPNDAAGAGARRGGGPVLQARAGGPPAGGAPGAPPGAGGRGGPAIPGGGSGMVNGTDLIAAIDWLEAEASDRDSRFYRKVDVDNVAAMGMSCGGLMSYGASKDPRVTTVGIWNSGLLPDTEDNPGFTAGIYAGIHGSVIIVTGGESDIAYENGKRDFEVMPEGVPTFYGVYPAVGHGGTYEQDNGGPFGVAAVAWLKWQLEGDRSAAGRGYFSGKDCAICRDTNWVTDSRALR